MTDREPKWLQHPEWTNPEKKSIRCFMTIGELGNPFQRVDETPNYKMVINIEQQCVKKINIVQDTL